MKYRVEYRYAQSGCLTSIFLNTEEELRQFVTGLRTRKRDIATLLLRVYKLVEISEEEIDQICLF